VLNDKNKVSFVALDNAQRLDALRQDQIDLLARNTTWTYSRDVAHGMSFVGVNYYDNQGVMVRRGSGITAVSGQRKYSLCVQSDTTTIKRIEEFFETRKQAHSLRLFASLSAAGAAYEAGECEALSSDKVQLYSLRSRFLLPQEHVILDEDIMKEPLAIAVKDGDPQWFDIVRWTLFALINAEEMGIASSNVATLSEQSTHPDVRYLLGVDGDIGDGLGLDKHWLARAVKQVGNYAEIFERNLGRKTGLGIPRGLNKHWRRGGLLFAPTMR
jgi:general L-amino acid transport system substrate-binding protein